MHKDFQLTVLLIDQLHKCIELHNLYKRQWPFCFGGVSNRAPRIKWFSRC